MSETQRIITGHYIQHWGVPGAIRPMKARWFEEFAILEFPPKGGRSSWRYATNGMSSYAQSMPNGGVGTSTEVYVGTECQADWVVDLLIAIAAYPFDFSTRLCEGDTIDVGRPVDSKSSSFTGVLIAAPDLYDSHTLGAVAKPPPPVLIHLIIGLYASELAFAAKQGSACLRERLTAEDVPLDRGRKALNL